MSSLFECNVLAPARLCHHRDLLVYLVPSVLLALLIRALSARHPFFFLFTLAGTVGYELVSASSPELTASLSQHQNGRSTQVCGHFYERLKCPVSVRLA
ncbi:MAG TPA: hypothetical protein VN089_13125 [Duganella sp.]|nr:hypothetical protein [Duganella sp.]